MPLKPHCHWAHERPLGAHRAPEPLLHLMPDGLCSHLQGNLNNNILKWPVGVLEEGKRGPNWVYPTGSSLSTIYHCKTVIVKKVIVYKKKFCIPLNDLSLGIWAASGLKHFISALTHISVDVYSFIWHSTVRNGLSCYWTLVWQLLVVAALDADHPGLGLHLSFHCAPGSVCGVSPAIQTYRAVLGEWI